jgi:hypothetical protein
MRTVQFQRVFDRIVRMMGRDAKDDINDNMRDGIIDHVNDRVGTIAQLWNWPEWDVTEERAFRQVWNPNHQYKKVSDTDGQPDEVFYIPNTTYYKVNPDAASNPPVGESPVDTPSIPPVHWLQLDNPIDTYVEYDQVCKRAIGVVRGVFGQNPTVMPSGGCCSAGIKYMPSEKGLQIKGSAGPTVFILYSMPIPEYTITPFVAGKTYPRASIVLDPTVGECFQALQDTQALPADATQWKRVPFLEAWEDYVVWGAFSDCLMEYDQGGMEDLQAKMVLSQHADQNADDMMQQEIDVLATQGQVLHWKAFPRYGYQTQSCWRDSQDWSGGTVTSLTDACEDDLGWVYPSPPQIPQITWEFHPEVISVDGLALALIQLPTINRLSGSLVEIVVGPSGDRQRTVWQILSGAANPLDGGQKAPLDYDPVNNNKHWELV